VPGDAWERKPLRFPDAQLSAVQTNVAELLGNGQPIGLSGDNLYLDLDLSEANMPSGTQLRIVDVVLEVTPKLHNGCRKFATRFGHDALRFVSERQNRHRNLRGIYLRVVRAGDVKVGDVVEVMRR
jgi:MOSC domain-containing protein YiiM